MKKDHIITFFKGLVIGGTMLVPGVSGGTMAMTLGIYGRLIEAVSTLRQLNRRKLLFLALFTLGGGLGMLIFSNPLLLLLERWPRPTIYFFLGAVAGAVPMICRHAQVRSFSPRYVLYIVLGVLAVLALSVLPTDLIPEEASKGLLHIVLLMAAGFFAAIALILPGVSVSYFLLLLGLYDKTMRAISRVDLVFLLPLLIGLVIGILLATKLLDRAMSRYPNATYLIILGFVLGSIIDTFPGVPLGWESLACLLTASVGFCLILLLSRMAETQQA